MFSGIGALPKPATESHVVNRGTPVAPCRLKAQRKRVTRVGSPRSPVTVNLKLSRTFSFSTLAGTVACGEPQYLETFRAGADPGIILSVLVVQLVGRMGGDGFWEGDYGWGVRVCRHFGARGRSSVRY